MEKSCFAAVVGTLVIPLILQGDAGGFGKMITGNCSCYTVYRPRNDFNWEKSKELCEKNGSALVSIEVKEELSFLKRKLIMNNLKDEYFIGLRNVSGNWQWMSNSSLVFEDKNLLRKLNKGDGDDCVKMYFEGQGVVFDDIKCQTGTNKVGCICEQPLPCQDTKDNRPSGCRHSTAKPPQVTSASQPSTSFKQQSRTIVSLPTTLGKVISDVPASKAGKDNSKSITIILTALAVIILAILILIWFFLGRRPWSKASSLKTQTDDGNQHQENSNQITMRANLTPSEEGLDTYDAVNDDKQVHTYEKIENGNTMPGSVGHRESSVRAQEPIMQKQSGDDYLVPSDLSEAVESTKQPDPCDENSGEKETTKEHVYAVVHVHQGQGSAIFRKDTTAQEQSMDLTGASHLPFIGESREEIENSSPVISEKTVSMTEDYLYAVVDKAKQKPKPPQMPAPYCSLVYADLSHSPEKSAGSISRRNLPTIYAAIDYGKTHEIKSKLPEENMDQSTESTDGSE